MATPDQIPSDLTLEISENLSPDKFISAARAFFGYVEEVTKTVTGETAGDWIVRTRDGSHLIGLDPGPRLPRNMVNSVYEQVYRGMRDAEAGHLDESGLSDAAMKHLKALSEISDRPKRRPITVRLWIEKQPHQLTGDIARTITESWKTDYRDFGTVEGRLDAIQERDGLQIRVRDQLLGHTIACYMNEDMLPEAFASFRKRVELSGTIHYRKNGTPISIAVQSIMPMPEDDELPSIDDVQGILRPQTA